MQDAQLAYSANDLDSAKGYYLRILNSDNNHIVAHKQLIQIAKEQKDFTLLYPLLKKTIKIDKNDFDTHLLLGEIYLAQSQLEKAFEIAKKLEAINSDHPKSFEFKLAILFSMEDNTQVQALARQRLKKYPDDLKAAVVVGMEYFTHGNYDKVLNVIEAASIAHQSDVTVHQLKANALWEKGLHLKATAVLSDLAHIGGEDSKEIYIRHLINNNKIDQSIELLQKYRDQREDWLSLRLLLAELYRAEGNFVKAKKEYKELVIDAKKNENPDSLVIKSSYTFLANILLKEDKPTDALQYIEEVLKEDSEYSNALIVRAKIHLLNDKKTLAISDLNKVIINEDSNYNARQLLAGIFMSLGEEYKAIEQYNKLIALGDNTKSSRLNYTKALLSTRQYQKAEMIISHWIKQNPKDTQSLALRIQARLNLNERDSALKDIDIVESFVGENALLFSTRGDIYREQGRFNAAINSYQKSFLLKPTYDVAEQLKVLYIQQNKTEVAKRFIQREFKDNDFLAATILAALYEHEGNDKKVEEIYRKIIKNQPKESFAYIKLASYFGEKKNYEQAELILKNGITSTTNYYHLQALLAQTYEIQERYSEALDIYEQMIMANADDLLPVNNFIHLILEYKPTKANLDIAANYAERLKNVNSIAIQDTLGWLYYKLNDFDTALIHAKKASQTNPPIADIHYHLGKIHQARGNYSLAEFALERALKLGGDDFEGIEDAKSTLAVLVSRKAN